MPTREKRSQDGKEDFFPLFSIVLFICFCRFILPFFSLLLFCCSVILSLCFSIFFLSVFSFFIIMSFCFSIVLSFCFVFFFVVLSFCVFSFFLSFFLSVFFFLSFFFLFFFFFTVLYFCIFLLNRSFLLPHFSFSQSCFPCLIVLRFSFYSNPHQLSFFTNIDEIEKKKKPRQQIVGFKPCGCQVNSSESIRDADKANLKMKR
jgi:hypothetical protein